MSDVALIWDGEAFAADLAVASNDLVAENGLQTAVELSLFLDRRAENGDQLPAGETDRRGWWGDGAPVVEGDRIGSRLWLLAREKQTNPVRERLEKYARQALQWLVDDKVAERVEVAATFPSPGLYVLEVEIYRPRADPVKYRFDRAWDQPSSLPDAIPELLTPDPLIVDSGDVPLAVPGGYLGGA